MAKAKKSKTKAPAAEEKVKEKVEEQVEEKPEEKAEIKEKVKSLASDWFDKLMQKGEKEVSKLPNQTRGYAEQALKFIAGKKSSVLDLGEEGFEQFMGLFSNGQYGKARDYFIKTKLGPADLIAEFRRSSRAARQAAERKAKFEEQAMTFVSDLSVFAARVLMGVLFA